MTALSIIQYVNSRSAISNIVHQTRHTCRLKEQICHAKMLSSTLTNYRDLYFEHKNMTRINIEPTVVTLQQLLLELKANTVWVPSILG